MLIWILFAIALAFSFGCTMYDDIETLKGVKSGVAIEGYTFLVGSKPTATALYLRDFATAALMSVPTVVAALLHSLPFAYAGLVGPAIIGIKHIQGGRAWAKLLAGQKPTNAEKFSPQ